MLLIFLGPLKLNMKKNTFPTYFYGLDKSDVKYKLEFRESDVSPGKTEVEQGKFVKLISQAKGYFKETYKSQNIKPISPTPMFTLGIIRITVHLGYDTDHS